MRLETKTMNPKNYTTKEISQLISAQVDVECDAFWTEQQLYWGGRYLQIPQLLPNETGCREVGIAKWDLSLITKAYTFVDVLRAIEALGEKNEKNNDPFENGDVYVQHKLLEAFLADNMDMRGENVSAFLTELFKKKI
jgi:hypothetical protein